MAGEGISKGWCWAVKSCCALSIISAKEEALHKAPPLFKNRNIKAEADSICFN